MESLFALEWKELFGFGMPELELIVRGTVMYWFLFFTFRFVVRRDVGSVGISDILILVVVADASQNAMAGEYTSISGGMVLVSTLIGWNMLFDWLSFRFPAFRRFAEPSELLLIRDGRIIRRNMRREFITDEEMWSKLHEAGIESLHEVKTARLEPDGQISVVKIG